MIFVYIMIGLLLIIIGSIVFVSRIREEAKMKTILREKEIAKFLVREIIAEINKGRKNANDESYNNSELRIYKIGDVDVIMRFFYDPIIEKWTVMGEMRFLHNCASLVGALFNNYDEGKKGFDMLAIIYDKLGKKFKTEGIVSTEDLTEDKIRAISEELSHCAVKEMMDIIFKKEE